MSLKYRENEIKEKLTVGLVLFLIVTLLYGLYEAYKALFQ